MEVLAIALFVVAGIIGTIIVNFAYKLYMKIMGADTMYYSPKKKLVYIIIVGGAIWMFMLKLFVLGGF